MNTERLSNPRRGTAAVVAVTLIGFAAAAIGGGGTGGCSSALRKTAQGKQLVLAVTVQYEGATKSVQLRSPVGGTQ